MSQAPHSDRIMHLTANKSHTPIQKHTGTKTHECVFKDTRANKFKTCIYSPVTHKGKSTKNTLRRTEKPQVVG